MRRRPVASSPALPSRDGLSNLRQLPQTRALHAPTLPPPPAAGRFAGPLVVAAVTRIATPSGETGVCTQWDDAGEDCIGPPNEQCIITGGGCTGRSLHADPAGLACLCPAHPA